MDDADRGFRINLLFGLVDLAPKITGKPWCDTEFYFNTDPLKGHSYFVYEYTGVMKTDMVVILQLLMCCKSPLLKHYEIG